MTTATLRGIDLATAVPEALVVSVSRDLVGEQRTAKVDIPGRAGSVKFGEEPGDRTIRLTLHILADSFAERRAACRALAEWVTIPPGTELVIDDEPTAAHLVALEGNPAPDEWLTAADIELTFIADPYPIAATPSTGGDTATGNYFASTITNPGAIDVEPTITLIPAGGTLTSFVLTVGDSIVTWFGNLPANALVTIDTPTDTATIGGVNDDERLTGAVNASSAVFMATVSAVPHFPVLEPGVNPWTLQWAGTATSVAVTFTWRERMV